MTSSPTPDPEHDSDDDTQNDDIIASAFRGSLIVLMLMGIPLIGWLIYLNVGKKKDQSTEVEVTSS